MPRLEIVEDERAISRRSRLSVILGAARIFLKNQSVFKLAAVEYLDHLGTEKVLIWSDLQERKSVVEK